MVLFRLCLFFVVLGFTACGDEKKPISMQGQPLSPEVQAQINEIEKKRRSAGDFKCDMPDIPGHNLGPNPACPNSGNNSFGGLLRSADN